MARLPLDVLKDVLLGAGENAVAGAIVNAPLVGGINAALAPEGERGKAFLHGAGRGALWGAGTGAVAGGLGAGIGGRNPAASTAMQNLAGAAREEGAGTLEAMRRAWSQLSSGQKAALIVPSAVLSSGVLAEAEVERRRLMNKEGGVMLETWLNKLADGEMSERDRERGLKGMTLAELDALLTKEAYSPELLAAMQDPQTQQAFQQSGVVLDPELMATEPRRVMAVPPTQEEHIAKQREEGGRAMGSMTAIPGTVAGALGGGTAAHALQGLMQKRVGGIGQMLAAKSHNVPLELGGAALGAVLGGVGGYHAGKPVGALLSERAAAKDSPELIQATADVDLANKLYRQGVISKNEMLRAEQGYDTALEQPVQPELPKVASLQQFAAKLACAACSKTEKKSVLKKQSGTEYAGADSIKTASLQNWVASQLSEIEKRAGWLERAGQLIGGAAKKAAPAVGQAATKVAPAAEDITARAAQHAKEMESFRAMMRGGASASGSLGMAAKKPVAIPASMGSLVG